MKTQYPFCYLTIPPTVEPSQAEIRVVAVNKRLIEAVGGVESDFLGDYSKELHLIVLWITRKGVALFTGLSG